MRVRVGLAALVVGVLVTACTADDDVPGPTAEESGPAAPGGTSPSAQQAAAAEPSPTASSRELSPDEALLAHFELESGDSGDVDPVRAFQEGLARCMADRGFEYVPDAPEGPATEHLDPGTDEWAAIYGYGISIDTSDAYGDVEPLPDPNAEYVESLSDQGREAYRQALDGTLGEGERPTGADGELGCNVTVGEALAESEGAVEPPELVRQLWREISETWMVRYSTDQRMLEAAADYVACVVDAGGAEFDPFAGETNYGHVSEAYDGLLARGEPSAAELAEFQEWERAIATAHLRCAVDIHEVGNELWREVTSEVVAPHRAELELLAAEWPP